MKFAKIISAILAITFFTGCNNISDIDISSLSAPQSQPAFPTPEQSIDIAFTALKEGDIDTLNQYVEDSTYSIETFGIDIANLNEIDHEAITTIVTDITTKLYKNFEYTITQTTETDDTATVTTVFVTPNGETLVTEVVEDFAIAYTKSMFSGEVNVENLAMDAVQILSQNLDSPDLEMTETTTDITLKKGEEHWIIVADEKLYDAITGGTITASENLMHTVEMFMP